jgi:trk/ktr system potassium uptake protein
MKIVILGCGRVGARLAQLMVEDGHQVSIIDSDPSALNRLPANFEGQVVLGTGIDVDVLKAGGVAGADAFAAVTNFDNTNIMACQVAKEIFGVRKVLARIYDPGREGLYHQLGLETICPTTLISTAAHDILMTPQDGTTGPLRVDTTQDVVAVAAALADAHADFDRDHAHTTVGATPASSVITPSAQNGATQAAQADQPTVPQRHGLFRR